MAVAAGHGVDGPADVDVVFLLVGQIHGLPVVTGGGARQAGNKRGGFAGIKKCVLFVCCVIVGKGFTWISRTAQRCWDLSPDTRGAFQDTRRMCTSGSYTCTCLQPGFTKIKKGFKLIKIKNEHKHEFKRWKERGGDLELGVSSSCLWITEEGDDRGAECVLLVVVLGAVGVRQLDQAVVIWQVRVCIPKIPRTAEEEKNNIYWGWSPNIHEKKRIEDHCGKFIFNL